MSGRSCYCLDDGVYGSFGGQIQHHAVYPVDSLDRKGPRFPCALAGRMMGAHTAASAAEFNFMPRARIVAVNQRARRSHAD
jgi:hypothetical protein